jgi:diaminohydroxyphosphoribosylaminopyrimidine deaminase / 5-amino-6-(5-phosphoribosylamino)uracil reductase
MYSDFDRQAMGRALELAARGLESTDPNPRVGCVIAHGTRIIAEGWHRRAGEAHAEAAALEAAGAQAADATVYVNLEPCSHQGRTPPCAAALIRARVARVVYALADPNPQVNGQGAAALRAAGIAVESGLLEAQALELNRGFIKRMQSGHPWVRVKLAMSLDGRTALASGASRWISGEAARQDVQRWRARSSAILTGIGTVLADDPRLDVREAHESGGEPRQPLRVLLDSKLRTPPRAQVLAGGGEVLILTAPAALADAHAGAELSSRGARIESVPGESGQLALESVLERLAELEVNELQVEAGPTLVGALVRAALVDELLVYLAPKLLGEQARPLVALPQLERLEEAPGFTILATQQLGDDLRLLMRPRAPASAAGEAPR